MIHYLWWVAFVLVQFDTLTTVITFLKAKSIPWWLFPVSAVLNLLLGIMAGYFNMFGVH